jgi:hypothetical protein
MKTPMMTKVFEMRAKEAGVTVEQYLKDQAAGLPLRRMSDPEDCVAPRCSSPLPPRIL